MTPSAPAMQTAGEAVDKPLERATLGERCDALKTARARRWTGQPTSPPRTGGPVVPPTAPPAVTRGGSATRAAAARATSVSGAVRRRVPRRAASSTLRHRRDRYARYASDKTAAGRYWRRVRRRRHAVGCPRVTRSSMWNQTTRDPAPQSRSKLCRTWPGGCPVR